MHFRTMDDLDFGRWKKPDDILGLLRPGQSKICADSPKQRKSSPASHLEGSPKCQVSSSSSSSVSSSVTSSESLRMELDDANSRPIISHDYPKRVSFTLEEQRDMVAPSPMSSADDSEPSESETDDINTPLEVAEILRQLRQGPCERKSPFIPTTTKKAYPGTHPVPPNPPSHFDDHHDDENDGEELHPSKRSATHGDLAVVERQANLGLKSAQHHHSNHPHRPVPKRVRWYTNLPSHKSTPQVVVPPLCPIKGLSPYDVLLGESMISHTNTGNRRFLVLAIHCLDRYFSSRVEVRVNIVDSLYSAVRDAGGQFLFMDSEKGGFEECTEVTAKLELAKILRRQEEVRRTIGPGVLQMFQKNCQFIWKGTTVHPAGPLGKDKSTTEQADIPSEVAPTEITKETIPKTLPSKKCDTSPKQKARITTNPAIVTESNLGLLQRGTPKRYDPMTPLAKDFTPGPFDVICSRGKPARDHPGNRYFVSLIESHIEPYTKAVGKLGKSTIVTEILDTIRRNSPNGGFVKRNAKGRWCETGDHLAREKIGQCFRDRLHTMYSSSSKAKLVKRRQRGKQLQGETEESRRQDNKKYPSTGEPMELDSSTGKNHKEKLHALTPDSKERQPTQRIIAC